MSDSLRSHELQPDRLLSPWDSPGENTGVDRAISSSKGSSQPRDWTHISCTGRQILSRWATWEVPRGHSVQSFSRVRLFATLWTAARQASLSITNSRSWLKLMSIESVMPSSHLILCRPLLLLPSIPPSIRVFPNKLTLCMRWPLARGNQPPSQWLFLKSA